MLAASRGAGRFLLARYTRIDFRGVNIYVEHFFRPGQMVLLKIGLFPELLFSCSVRGPVY